jgi:SAM-dependent methyltransferase
VGGRRGDVSAGGGGATDGFAGRLPCGRWSVWRYHWLPRHRLVATLRRVRDHAHGTLLDVGCGGRAFAPLFRGRAERYLGLDRPGSPERNGPRPDVHGDAQRLPVRDGAVDTVLCLAVLNLVPDPARALAEMRRVLAPGGVAVLEFVQNAPLYPGCPDLWRFTRPGIERLLAAAGLEPVEILPVGRLPMFAALGLLPALNRLNRGRRRVLTEIPVRVLYVVVQSAAAVLDRLWSRSGDVVAHVVVARPGS